MPYFDDLKKFREKAGVSATKLAKEAGVARSTISRVEKHRPATRQTLFKIVNALNALYQGSHFIELDDVVEDDDRTTDPGPRIR